MKNKNKTFKCQFCESTEFSPSVKDGRGFCGGCHAFGKPEDMRKYAIVFISNRAGALQLTSNIASKDLANEMAKRMKERGDLIICVHSEQKIVQVLENTQRSTL